MFKNKIDALLTYLEYWFFMIIEKQVWNKNK